MNKKENWSLIVGMIILWRIFLIGGTSYIVFWKGYSGWWFVLAIMLSINWEEMRNE